MSVRQRWESEVPIYKWRLRRTSGKWVQRRRLECRLVCLCICCRERNPLCGVVSHALCRSNLQLKRSRIVSFICGLQALYACVMCVVAAQSVLSGRI